MLVAGLTGAIPLAVIAEACGLSPGHLARAFRRSTVWRPCLAAEAGVEYAMTLLRQADSSLSQIALFCGFADYSHVGRIFTRQTGRSPHDWRAWQSGRNFVGIGRKRSFENFA
jgi:AraC family transcriptional regulator